MALTGPLLKSAPLNWITQNFVAPPVTMDLRSHRKLTYDPREQKDEPPVICGQSRMVCSEPAHSRLLMRNLAPRILLNGSCSTLWFVPAK